MKRYDTTHFTILFFLGEGTADFGTIFFSNSQRAPPSLYSAVCDMTYTGHLQLSSPILSQWYFQGAYTVNEEYPDFYIKNPKEFFNSLEIPLEDEDTDCNSASVPDSESDSFPHTDPEDPEDPETPTAPDPFTTQLTALTSGHIRSSSDLYTMMSAINGISFTFQKSLSECLPGLLRGVLTTVSASPVTHLSTYLPLVCFYLQDSECLLPLLEQELSETAHNSSFHLLTKLLYEEDLLADEDILSWHKDSNSLALKALMAPFIEWLCKDC